MTTDRPHRRRELLNNDNRRSRKGSEKEPEKNDGQIIPKTRNGNRAKLHTITTPKSGKASEPTTGKPEAETLPASDTTQGTPTGRQKAPRMKKHTRNRTKAHSGPQMKPERATDPQPASIHGGNAARNHTKQPNGTSKAERRQDCQTRPKTEPGKAATPHTTHHKPHREPKRPQPEQIHTKATKRHTKRNYKAADKRRTQERQNHGKRPKNNILLTYPDEKKF